MTTKMIIGSAMVCMIAPVLAEVAWETNFSNAEAQAKKEGKELLVLFTGSDWCPSCQVLAEKVLNKPEFQTEAAKKYVLVKIDFPRAKQEEEDIKKQNEQLAKKYGIKEIPVMVLMDSNGVPYGLTSGVAANTPNEMLGVLEKKEVKHQEYLKAIKEAESLTGEQKAKALVEALKNVPEEYLDSSFYADKLKELSVLDPKAENQILKPIYQKKDFQKAFEVASQAHEQGNMEKFQKVSDDFLARKDLMTSIRQEAMMAFRFQELAGKQDYDKMLTFLDKVIAVDPHTAIAKNLVGLRKRLAEQIEAMKSQGPDTPAPLPDVKEDGKKGDLAPKVDAK